MMNWSQYNECVVCGGRKKVKAEYCRNCWKAVAKWSRPIDAQTGLPIQRTSHETGEVWLYYPDYATAAKDGSVSKIRYVAGEFILGRPLKSNEYVRLRNGSRSDVRPENLIVATTFDWPKLPCKFCGRSVPLRTDRYRKAKTIACEECIASGRSSGMSISAEQVARIRDLCESGERPAAIAKEVGTTRRVVSSLFCKWRSEGLRIAMKPKDGMTGVCNHQVKLNKKKVLQIHRMREIGTPYHCIARKFGISKRLVSNICLGKSWKHLGLKSLSHVDARRK